MSGSNSPVLTAYAESLGIRVFGEEDGAPVLAFEFGGDVEGRPQHLHGGAISGLLETAGYALLQRELEKRDRKHRLKPINITVQFLSPGKQKTTYAKARITKLGSRNANIAIEAWQDDRDRPIATATINILMGEPDS
ncbi:PaaI family thioesterase [Pontixanthobacter aquaemixtae]|uniref:Hotdog fold thioesterase n=1 Tax=Pontixanthobacter aquaemixtae TaxID=1958940 RepID=A0A844ZMU7_9SPHN|nr:PaaI family thioesterase [Pontixanthobacter aquaemixtae]MXO89711.1 hotdog fold thioesterase [Pontixanthobacter aquaemixtae]